MATYAEMAPIIQGTGITKTQVESYFSNIIKEPNVEELPAVTKAKVQAIANAIIVDGIEKHNGLLGLARSVDLKVEQVKEIIKEIETLKTAWLEKQTPPVEG